MIGRESDSHKGENGKVAVVGGSKDFTGAPALSARAALRSGCDLAKVVTSEEVSDVVTSYSENLIVREYPGGYLGSDSFEVVMSALEWSDVAVVGPGLSSPSREGLGEIFDSPTPLVVDAEAIPTAVESRTENVVLTPHRGEVSAITDEFGSIEDYVSGDRVVLRKREKDVVYSSGGETEIEVGCPGMTVGGTGDVLAGIVAGLISQGVGLEEAAVRAAEINGKAGEMAAEEYGNGLLATDLLDLIPKV